MSGVVVELRACGAFLELLTHVILTLGPRRDNVNGCTGLRRQISKVQLVKPRRSEAVNSIIVQTIVFSKSMKRDNVAC